MRSIHVVPSIAKEASGPSYSVVGLCKALLEEGNEVTLAALDWTPGTAAPPFVRRFPLGWGPRRLGRSPAMHRWLRHEAASGKVDLIHNHGMWQMNSIYPAQAARGTAAQLVVSPRGTFSSWAMAHGSWTKKIFWPILQRPSIEPAACFHATAESEWEEIRRLGFSQPVAIVPNGIDILEIGPKGTAPIRTLLFLGRIHAKKGLDLLLPAWEAVQRKFPDWRLVLAGSDSSYYGSTGYLSQLKSWASVHGLKRVEFVGELIGMDKARMYRDADLFILPTYSENFGVTVAEALAAGTPAIVTKGAPWPKLAAHNCGWWIDITVDALVGCLEEALAQPVEKCAAMGERGRAWMRTEFSWPQVGQKMDRTYRWLIHGGARPEWIRVD